MNTEEAEVERFQKDLQHLLELTAPKDVLFIIGNWNEKVESQETRGVTERMKGWSQNKNNTQLWM